MMKVPLSAHQREVAHEDRLALDLTGVVVGELGGDVERRGVGEVLLLALVDGVLRVVEDRVLERERHRLGEVLDRGDLLEDLLETGLARRRPRPRRSRASTAVCQASLPTSQSKLSVWRERSWGTSRGSLIFANEMRAAWSWSAAVVRAAKRVSFDGCALGDGADRPLNQPPGRRLAFEGRRNAQRYPKNGHATRPADPLPTMMNRRCATMMNAPRAPQVKHPRIDPA